jgi:hypothetical protein
MDTPPQYGPLDIKVLEKVNAIFKKSEIENGIQTSFLNILYLLAFDSENPARDLNAVIKTLVEDKPFEDEKSMTSFGMTFYGFYGSIIELAKVRDVTPLLFKRKAMDIAEWLVDTYSGEASTFQEELDKWGKELLERALSDYGGAMSEKDVPEAMRTLSNKLDKEVLKSIIFPTTIGLSDDLALDLPPEETGDEIDQAYCRLRLIEYIQAAFGLDLLRRKEFKKIQSEQGRQSVQYDEPDRNDPCPCGSNKKYKHCHGRMQ